jgi:uncharacterized protein
MNPRILAIIEKYYPPGSFGYSIYMPHSRVVTELALRIAQKYPQFHADEEIIEFGGMLHDVGILFTDSPEIGCFGDLPYIAHGYKGRELLEKEGLPTIALICERHIGVGISITDIEIHDLPLPKREMIPKSIEEKIICYADKFYSKSTKNLLLPKPLHKVKKSISRYGEDKWTVFEGMIEMFGTDYIYSE